MRILHTADWHLGRSLEGRSRLAEQAAFLDELVDIVNEEQVDLILVAGDNYDSVNPPAAAEELFYDSIARLSDAGQRPIIIIAGNHDNPERLTASDPLAARQGIHLVGLPTSLMIKIPIARVDEEAFIYPLPYPSEARLKELLSAEMDEQVLRQAYSARIGQLLQAKTAIFSPKTVNIVMSHIYVMGGAESESERPIQVGGAYTVDTAALAVNAQYTALGHLHRPQTLKADTLVRYSGSPLAYSFSEAGQSKSVTIIDVAPGGEPQVKEIPLRSGKPLVRWQAKQGIADVHRWIDEGKDHHAWIDLEVHVDHALSMEQIQALREAHGGIIAIRPIFPELEEQMIRMDRSQHSIDEMFREFYKRQTGGAEPEEALVELFLSLIDIPAGGEGA